MCSDFPKLFGRTESDLMIEFLIPGQLVRNPEHPEWGLGQVQSVVQGKITVNFEEIGKVVIDGGQVDLELV